MNQFVKLFGALVVFLLCVPFLLMLQTETPESTTAPLTSTPPPPKLATAPIAPKTISAADTVIQKAFDSKRSKLQVEGEAVVYRVLPDDLDGSRHQKFLLRLTTGLSLLIAHNIDLAPRIDGISVGDTVEFYGVYEWNEKGGVVHWTHHDPAGRHIGGWLKFEGRTYQ